MTKDDIIIEQEKLKLELLKLEIEQKRLPSKNEKIDTVMATILVALIGFLGTTMVSLFNSFAERELKQREFESQLINKALEQPTREKRIDLLEFINKLNLIKDKETSRTLEIALKNPESIPSISTSKITLGDAPIEVDNEFKESPEPLSTLALKAAKKYVGTSEDMIDIIKKFNRGGNNRFWSCSFICWCYSQNSNGNPPFKFVYLWMDLKRELKEKKMFTSNVSSIRKGDIYFLESPLGGIHHGGIVEEIKGNSIVGIEGNVNNKVVRRSRHLSKISGVGKVK